MRTIEPYEVLFKREEQDNKELRELLEYKNDEIERLNKLVKGLRKERDYLFNKATTESNYEIKRLKKEKDILKNLHHFVCNEIKRILKDDDLSHIEKLQEIAKVVGDDKDVYITKN